MTQEEKDDNTMNEFYMYQFAHVSSRCMFWVGWFHIYVFYFIFKNMVHMFQINIYLFETFVSKL